MYIYGGYNNRIRWRTCGNWPLGLTAAQDSGREFRYAQPRCVVWWLPVSRSCFLLRLNSIPQDRDISGPQLRSTMYSGANTCSSLGDSDGHNLVFLPGVSALLMYGGGLREASNQYWTFDVTRWLWERIETTG